MTTTPCMRALAPGYDTSPACHGDTYLQGCEDEVIAGATHIMSRHACQQTKTLVFCTDHSKAEYVAAKVGATAATRGMVACGAALGYVSVNVNVNNGM